MSAQIESYNCPNCAAPLPAPATQNAWLCLYCNSLVRLPQGEESSAPLLDKTISEEEMAAIKQALLNGSREAAIQLYQDMAGGDLEQAQNAIDDLGRDLSLKTIVRQQLTPIGWVYVLLWSAFFVGGLWAGISTRLSWWVAALIAGFGAFNLAALFPAIVSTLRYLNASRAPATTVNFAYLGRAKLRREEVHLFKILLEVQPAGNEPFREQVLVPVRQRNTQRVQKGHVFQVKYLPGVPNSVIFDRS